MEMKHLAFVWTSGDFRGVEDMNRYWMPVALALAIAVNGSLLPSLFPGAVMPDLVLVIVVIAALTKPKGYSVTAAFVSGIIQDLLSGQFMGLNTGLNMLLAAVIGEFGGSLFRENLFTPFAIILASTFAKQFVYLVVIYAFGLRFGLALPTLYVVLLTGLLNAVIGSVIYKFVYLRRVDHYNRNLNV